MIIIYYLTFDCKIMSFQKMSHSPAFINMRSDTYRHHNQELLQEFVKKCEDTPEFRRILMVGKTYMMVGCNQKIPYGDNMITTCLEEMKNIQ